MNIKETIKNLSKKGGKVEEIVEKKSSKKGGKVEEIVEKKSSKKGGQVEEIVEKKSSKKGGQEAVVNVRNSLQYLSLNQKKENTLKQVQVQENINLDSNNNINSIMSELYSIEFDKEFSVTDIKDYTIFGPISIAVSKFNILQLNFAYYINEFNNFKDVTAENQTENQREINTTITHILSQMNEIQSQTFGKQQYTFQIILDKIDILEKEKKRIEGLKTEETEETEETEDDQVGGAKKRSTSALPTTSRRKSARLTFARARPTTARPTTARPTTALPTTSRRKSARLTSARALPTTALPTTALPTTALPASSRRAPGPNPKSAVSKPRVTFKIIIPAKDPLFKRTTDIPTLQTLLTGINNYNTIQNLPIIKATDIHQITRTWNPGNTGQCRGAGLKSDDCDDLCYLCLIPVPPNGSKKICHTASTVNMWLPALSDKIRKTLSVLPHYSSLKTAWEIKNPPEKWRGPHWDELTLVDQIKYRNPNLERHCEHILFFHLALLLGALFKSGNRVTTIQQSNYLWSHMICNSTFKNQVLYITYNQNPSIRKWEVNLPNIQQVTRNILSSDKWQNFIWNNNNNKWTTTSISALNTEISSLRYPSSLDISTYPGFTNVFSILIKYATDIVTQIVTVLNTPNSITSMPYNIIPIPTF